MSLKISKDEEQSFLIVLLQYLNLLLGLHVLFNFIFEELLHLHVLRNNYTEL